MHHVNIWMIKWVLKEEKETPKEENSRGTVQLLVVFLYCFFKE
jgi:hypothetical protein